MIVLAVFPNEFEAARIHSLLEAEGFHPESMTYSNSYENAGADQDFPIRIPKEEALRAAELLEGLGLGKFIWR